MHLGRPVVYSAATSVCGLVFVHCLGKVDVGEAEIILDNDVIGLDVSVCQALGLVHFDQAFDHLPGQVAQQIG